jgi:hypothetical protein
MQQSLSLEMSSSVYKDSSEQQVTDMMSEMSDSVGSRIFLINTISIIIFFIEINMLQHQYPEGTHGSLSLQLGQY